MEQWLLFWESGTPADRLKPSAAAHCDRRWGLSSFSLIRVIFPQWEEWQNMPWAVLPPRNSVSSYPTPGGVERLKKTE